MIGKIPQFWKAIIAFIAPAAVVITASVRDGSDTGSTISTAEWITALCACVITSAGVALKANKPAPTKPQGSG